MSACLSFIGGTFPGQRSSHSGGGRPGHVESAATLPWAGCRLHPMRPSRLPSLGALALCLLGMLAPGAFALEGNRDGILPASVVSAAVIEASHEPLPRN